jgi:multiple sugar transport system ATP-binding protein
MATITLRGLTKHYATRGGEASEPAVRDLDLDVADGELLVLVGPSGCGKSTALRLIAGLEEPTSGSIRLGERDLAAVPPGERDVAMVFQGYALYPHLSVAENIGFSLKMRGMGRAERKKRVAETADRLGLDALLERLPQELSGGERQRVAMGRAIVREPQVFLFDEPLSNLDAKLRARLRVELVELVRRIGTTSIYVTHDQTEAMTMADRIAVMDGGVLQQIDTPRAIYERPANRFVACFIGTPEINMLALKDGKLFGEAVPLPAGEAGALELGVRPEHVLLGEAAARGVARSEATVVASEPLGAHSVIHLEVGQVKMRARANGFFDIPPGQCIEMALDAEQLLWFDTASGERVDGESQC